MPVRPQPSPSTPDEFDVALIFIPAFDLGGTERQTIELLRGLRALPETDRGRIELVVIRSGGPLEADAMATGFPVHSLGNTSALSLPRTAARWIRLVRQRRPSAVYSLLSSANFIAAATRLVARPRRLVWGIRDDRLGVERRGVGRFLAINGTRLLARIADVVIVNSDAVRDGLRSSGLNRVPIEVIPNGIDTDRFRPSSELRILERERLGVSDDQLIVCVARLVPKKNHSMLLHAFADLHQQMPSTRLLCFGDGPDDYRRELESLVRELGLTDIASLERSRNDPEAIFNAADLAVLASDAEGFPNTIAEALACGTPCVSTMVGAAPALLDADSVSPVGDTAALTRTMIAALGRIDTDGRPRDSRLADCFTLGALARRTVDVLQGRSVRD